MLGIVIRIVKMNDSFVMGIHNLLGQQNAVGDIPGYLSGHIVPLGRVDDGVLVGVFLLGFLVVAFNQAEDLVVGGIRPARKRTGIACLLYTS